MRSIDAIQRVPAGLRLVLALMLVLGAAPQSAAAAPSNFTVTRFDDPAPDGCAVNGCSLREAVIAANGGLSADTILLPSGTYTLTRAGEDDLASVGDLDIVHSLTINVTGGASATIGASAAHNDRIFQVLGLNIVVTLNNLIIRGGDTQGTTAGGGLRVESSATVHLQNVTVRDNHAGGNAGGILNIGTLTMISSTVTNNLSAGADGGGGIFNDDNASLQMTGGAVISNTTAAATGGGGGLYLDAGSSATLQSIQVLSNTAGASSGGGGLLIEGTATANLNNVIMAGNDGGATGGAILNTGQLTANAMQFVNNHASTKGGAIFNRNQMLLTNSSVISNNAGGDGGGLFNVVGAHLTISDTSILSNTASFARGGGLRNEGNGQLIATGTVVAFNHAAVGAGLSNAGSLNLTGGEIRANQASVSGGGLLNTSFAALTGTVISANSALANGGGGIKNDSGGRLSLSGAQLLNNIAQTDGGGLENRAGASALLNSALLAGNHADGGGGLKNLGTLTVTLSVIRDNQSHNFGGGLYSTLTLSLLDSAVVSNTSTAGAGGGIYSSGSLSATNTTFSNNTAQGKGGGLIASGTLLLNNVTIANNHSLSDTAGGLRLVALGGVQNTIIAGNSAALGNPDCDGAIPSLDYILVQNGAGCSFVGATSHVLTNTSSVVGPLAAFGATWANPLLPLSPARDAGHDLTCAAADQRGLARPVGSHCDLGALEAADNHLLFLPLLSK